MMKIITKTVVKDYVSKRCPYLASLELQDRTLVDLLKQSIDNQRKYVELADQSRDEKENFKNDEEEDDGFNLYQILRDYPHLKKEIQAYVYEQKKNAVEELVEKYVDNQLISKLSRLYFEKKYGKELCFRCDTDEEGNEFIKQDFVVMMTKKALENKNIKVIFEGQIEVGNLRARFDVLIKNEDGTFDIVEVKGTNNVFEHPTIDKELRNDLDSKIKAKYLYDMLFQYHVYLKKYPQIRSLYYMYTKSEYELQSESYPVSYDELENLFVLTDEIRLPEGTVSLRKYFDSDGYVVENKVPPIEEVLSEINAIAKLDYVQPKQDYLCRKGPACPFMDTCFNNVSENPNSLMRLTNWGSYGGYWGKVKKMFENGKTLISEVSPQIDEYDEYKKDNKGRSNAYTQILYQKGQIKEKYVYDEDIVDQIIKRDYLNDEIDYLLFFDVESFQYPIPLVKNCHPWKQIVNQYSMHIVEKGYDLSKHNFDQGKGGKVTHFEYIANPDITGYTNPEIELYQTLKNQLESVGIDPYGKNYRVVVFNRNFEKTRMDEFVRDFKLLCDQKLLQFVVNFNNNVVDLLDFFTSGGLYSREFHGKGSLKVVQPRLAEDFDVVEFYKKRLPYDLAYTLDYHKGDKCLVYNGSICLDLYKSLLIRAHLGEQNQGVSTEKLLGEALAYCKIDSWGTVIIYDIIKNLYLGNLHLHVLTKHFGKPLGKGKEKES